MTTPKEPNFFSDDDVFQNGLDWYAALFADATSGQLTGEASTHYTKLPTHPHTIARMRAAQLRPKLIYMVRNPVERAVSHFIHAWSMGEVDQDPTTALAVLPEIVEYGRYAMQIQPYCDTFGVENIHLTSLEQVKADPDGELGKIAIFLGLEGQVAWQHEMESQNVSADRMRPFPLQGLIIDNPVARGLRRVLVPKALRDRIRKSRTMQERPKLTTEDVGRLEHVYRADRAHLATMFPGHPALDVCYPFAAK